MRKWILAAIALGLAFVLFRMLRQPPRHLVLRAPVSQRELPPQAPELTLTDLSGRAFSTSSLKGKVAVVNFWAAWCTPCTAEIPGFVALQQKYQGQGLQIIGISIDDSENQLRDFYHRAGMNYPVVSGNQKITQAFGGILGLPTTLIIGRDGRIEKKLSGTTDFAELEREILALLAVRVIELRKIE
jgi:peroxiredoxin